MKTYTNNSPGMRGITVNSETGPYIHYLDTGASVELDPKLVLAVPDLGPDKPEAGTPGNADLAAENADLRSKIADLTIERDELKAENADLRKAKEAPKADDITAAIGMLDKANDAHWTEAGLPAVDAVKELLGADVTRKQIEAAAPEAKRPSL